MNNKKIIIMLVVVICIPIALNYFLQMPSPMNNIIGNKQAPSVWLAFWASYSGATLSVFASLFILYKTLSQNHEENEKNRLADNKQFIIIQKKDDLNLLTENLIAYISCFNPNNFRKIYNKCRRSKNREAAIDDIGELYNEAFFALEKVTLLFDPKDLKSDDLKWLSKDYLSLLVFLDEFQKFITDETIWSDLESAKHTFDNLLYSHSQINVKEIEAKARKLVEKKRKEIENILQNQNNE